LNRLKAPYHFTHGQIPQRLITSIQSIGITNPPKILQTKNALNYILISGQRRIQIMYRLDKNALIPVHIYSTKELSSFEAFRLNLFDNLATRKLNAIEKTNILKILHQTFSVSLSEILSHYLPLLNLSNQKEKFDDYLKLQKLNKNIKDILAQEVLQVDSAIKLLDFNPKDRGILAHLIQKLNLGINNQKTLLMLAWEIYRREGIPFSRILALKSVKKILKNDIWTSSQKWSKLYLKLKHLRYPKLSLLEDQFNKIKKQIHIPPALILQNPPFFEGNEYLLQMHFKNLTEYQNCVSILNLLASEKAFGELFKLTLENE
jgi:hypothetical protein